MSWPASMLLCVASPFTAGLCSYMCSWRQSGQLAASLSWVGLKYIEQGAASQPEGSTCCAEHALPDSRLVPAKGSVNSSSSPAWCVNVGICLLRCSPCADHDAEHRGVFVNRTCPACSRVYITYLVLLLVTVVVTYIIYRIGKAKLA